MCDFKILQASFTAGVTALWQINKLHCLRNNISRCSPMATEGKHSHEESKQTATITGVYFRIRQNNIRIIKTHQCLIYYTCGRYLKTATFPSKPDSSSTAQLVHTVQVQRFAHTENGDLLKRLITCLKCIILLSFASSNSSKSV